MDVMIGSLAANPSLFVKDTQTPRGRGVFTYRVDDAGLITNLRGYWNLEAMTFGTQE